MDGVGYVDFQSKAKKWLEEVVVVVVSDVFCSNISGSGLRSWKQAGHMKMIVVADLTSLLEGMPVIKDQENHKLAMIGENAV